MYFKVLDKSFGFKKVVKACAALRLSLLSTKTQPVRSQLATTLDWMKRGWIFVTLGLSVEDLPALRLSVLTTAQLTDFTSPKKKLYDGSCAQIVSGDTVRLWCSPPFCDDDRGGRRHALFYS